MIEPDDGIHAAIAELWVRVQRSRPTDANAAIPPEALTIVHAGFDMGALALAVHLRTLSQTDPQLFADMMATVLGTEVYTHGVDPDEVSH